MVNEIVIFWFRRDLRLTDNAALFHALSAEYPVLPLFIFDQQILAQLDDKADRRVDFIYQALMNINQQLAKYDTEILIQHGNVLDIFSHLLKNYRIKAVYANRDYEPYAKERDNSVANLLVQNNAEFYLYKDQVIFEAHEVLKNDGTPYSIFTPYSKVWKSQFNEVCLKTYYSKNKLDNIYKLKQEVKLELSDIGFQKTDMIYKTPNIDEEIIAKYDQFRDFPALAATTNLGIHLRFGTISIRRLASKVKHLNETFLNELIWREFFMAILFHYPKVVNQSFKTQYDNIVWRNNEAEFKLWCEGKTGYPMVDAGMRQLNATGWLHNRVRMVVASFLCKHLLIDWRWGEAYFASKLNDYELSANNGNWQWAAGCGCDAAPYFRVFNPSEQARKFDPQAKYIKKWVPEIETFNYTQPIVEHAFARNRAIETYKMALTENM